MVDIEKEIAHYIQLHDLDEQQEVDDLREDVPDATDRELRLMLYAYLVAYNVSRALA